MVNALSLGHTRSVIAEVISGPEWAQQCHASLKKTVRDKGKLDEFKAASKESGKTFEKNAPAQLVFGRDVLFDVSFLTNWNKITASKHKTSTQNNERANTKRIKYT